MAWSLEKIFSSRAGFRAVGQAWVFAVTEVMSGETRPFGGSRVELVSDSEEELPTTDMRLGA